MPTHRQLEGQLALVTGASLRIGRAIALALAGEGASVAVHYHRSEAEALKVAAGVRRRGGIAQIFQADLADDAECVGLIPRINRQMGPVRILINNAALFGSRVLQDTSAEEWDHELNVDLRAPFRLSQSFAAQRGGRVKGTIVNISDWRGLRPGVDHFAYTVAKAALIKMTESMALALAPRIRVNCLALGSILLPAGARPDMVRKLVAKIPLARMGRPQDVTAGILYLLGPGEFVTGQTIFVDGGRHLVR